MQNSISSEELQKAEKLANTMMRVAPIVSLLILAIAYQTLSVDDALNAVQINASGAEFVVEWRLASIHSKLGAATHVSVLDRVYLMEDFEVTVNGKTVLLKKGTELKVGVTRIELLLYLAPLSIGLLYAALTTRSASRSVRSWQKSFEVSKKSKISVTAWVILSSIVLGVGAGLYLRMSAYFPLSLIYPIVDVFDVAYLSPDFKVIMSPGYVVLTYLSFAFAVVAAFSAGLVIYYFGRGTKIWIDEIRRGNISS